MRNLFVLSLLAATLVLTGCPGRKAVKEGPAASSENSGSTTGSGEGGLQEGQTLEGSQSGSAGAGAAINEKVIYFDFDSSEIRSDSREVVAAHARNLAANPNIKVRLEGHTDERGSREYNIGLGERRAQAVRRALMLQGVADAQVATVSYGEERAAVSGSDEEAWSKNRRVEIAYGN